jgi:hypothetical protein
MEARSETPKNAFRIFFDIIQNFKYIKCLFQQNFGAIKGQA